MDELLAERLRELPAVNELLEDVRVAQLVMQHGRDTVRGWIRAAVADARQQIASEERALIAGKGAIAALVLQEVAHRAAALAGARLGAVINATGVILHTGLGRAPLCTAARDALIDAAGACNLEVDLATLERRYRGSPLETIWNTLTGAEAAFVVNNNAAATVLALDGLCRGREVIISRGQLIEIGGSFRLPEVFAQSGALLREVGTTNRTNLGDYEQAIGTETAAILRVHPSNYQVVGFADTPGIKELCELAHAHGLPCIDDIGSGCLVDTTRFGLPSEPTFQASIAAGADLVLGSGDKLLGGPQCGILLGKKTPIEMLRKHPLARALRVDKLTLAALGATLDVYAAGEPVRDIPTLALLAATVESLLARAAAIRENLVLAKTNAAGRPGLPDGWTIEVAPSTATVGGGSLPGSGLPTAVLRIAHQQSPADELAQRLRLGSPRVVGRIEQSMVLLDLRSVLPESDSPLTEAIQNLWAGSRDN